MFAVALRHCPKEQSVGEILAGRVFNELLIIYPNHWRDGKHVNYRTALRDDPPAVATILRQAAKRLRQEPAP